MKRKIGEDWENAVIEELQIEGIVRKMIQKTLDGSVVWTKVKGQDYMYSSCLRWGELRIQNPEGGLQVVLTLVNNEDEVEYESSEPWLFRLYRLVSCPPKTPILELFCEGLGVYVDDAE
ncbi:MAG: hypothetical protein KGL39_37645 [Patescibacteria group bacterium]|nr:hypothetical protein [Patescibacteria group bacterium]